MNITNDVFPQRPDFAEDPGRPPDAGPSSSDKAAEVVQRVAQGAHQGIDQLQRGVHSGMEQARVSVDQWSGTLRETVREHPLASVGSAFALGMIFARLLR